jgi:hypothetical protein
MLSVLIFLRVRTATTDLLGLSDMISSHIVLFSLEPHIQHYKIKLDAYADLFLFLQRYNLMRHVKF